MTLQKRSPQLAAALEERDTLKIELHFLQENGGSQNDILAASNMVAELDWQIHGMRRGLVGEPLARQRRGGQEPLEAV